MKLKYTRAMVTAALNGTFDDVEYKHDEVFNVDIPQTCPNVPSEIMNLVTHGKIKPLTMHRLRSLLRCSRITLLRNILICLRILLRQVLRLTNKIVGLV